MVHECIVKLDNGKLRLIRKLCLLLSPAPHHPGHQDKETQTPPVRPPPPPPTPRPDSVTNSHNKPTPGGKDTDDDHLAEQGDRKRSKSDQGRDTAPSLTPGRAPSPKPGPLAPPPYPGPPGPQGPRRSYRLGTGGRDRNPEEGGVEGHPPTPPPGVGDPDHPPPTPENGHNREKEDGEKGAVGGSDETDHPPPPPPQNDPEQGLGLAGNVACLLSKWEDLFNLLVQNIEDDLGDYWKKLSTPQ